MNETAAGNSGAPVSIWPTTWKYSLIIGIVAFVYTLALYLTGLASSNLLGFIRFIIYVVLLVVGLRGYRIRNNGYLGFGTAYGMGFMISAFSSVISSVLNFIYLSMYPQVLADLLKTVSDQFASTPGMDQRTTDMVMGIFNYVFSPGGMLTIGICSGIFAGVVVGLIVAAFVKDTSVRN